MNARALIRTARRCRGPRATYDQFSRARNIALVEVMLSTGIRVGELLGLTVKDVDLTDRVLYIMGKGRRPRQALLTDRGAHSALRRYVALRRQRTASTDNYF